MRQWWRHIAATAVVLSVAATAVAQPVAIWNETSHDFGTFQETLDKQSCQFVVTNTGDSALVIVQVKSTCGCTVAQHSSDPVMPGENSTIDITYSPAGRPGPFQKTVWVYTNSTPSPTRLTVSGVVVGSPQSVKQYFPVGVGDLQFTKLMSSAGEVRKGLIRNNAITAYNSGNDTLIISFDNNTSHINPRAVPDTVAPGGISTISLFFNSAMTPVWGINDDYVTIIATPLNSSKPPIKAEANVVSNVIEDFSNLIDSQLAQAPVCSTSTSKITFDDLKTGEITQATMQITNTGKSDLIVRRVMALDKAITAKCDNTRLKPRASTTITIKVNPAKVDGNILNSQFTIITNDPFNPTNVVNVVGEIK
ncbi:MAG: DUF1573 domain-containing protein [Muribaculaceae bacterium]|nr:DUF1573 domain-containing protein [Muribaculaceae bacterium]